MAGALSPCIARNSASEKKNAGGESGYHMEILLVSSRLAEKSEPVEKLRRRIGAFKDAAEEALGASKIQAWGLS